MKTTNKEQCEKFADIFRKVLGSMKFVDADKRVKVEADPFYNSPPEETIYHIVFDDDYHIETSIEKENRWYAFYVERIPGRFNPRNGGSPPEDVDHEIIGDANRIEVIKAVIMYYITYVITDALENEMYEDIEKNEPAES